VALPVLERRDGSSLELVDSKNFSTGVVYLTFQPAGR
jgi:hypothetical protein